jgi:tetratricopeptide (TPR) repeat protein
MPLAYKSSMSLTTREPAVAQSPTSPRMRRTASPAAMRLGERLRQLRVAAGMTQTDLAGDRFSKEYVSQIERGKTRPTRETIAWLAQRLGVDAGFLERGISADERGKVEALLARADALMQARHYDEAVAAYEDVHTAVLSTGSADLEVRCLSGLSWARMERGELRKALDLLNRARTLAEGPEFSHVDRADVLFRLGVARYKLSSIATAVGLFTEALNLAEGSGLPCDVLRSDILGWRSRCYRRQRDLEAAREDVERALELAQALDDRRTMANVYWQASLVAERMGHWVRARNYAERAKAYYEQLNDERNVGRLLNDLGGLNLMLDKPEQAIDCLKASFSVAIDHDSTEDASLAAVSLAQVHLKLQDWTQAEQHAQHALELIGDRVDWLHVISGAQLTLGRALMEQERLDEAERYLRDAELSAEQLESVAHRAAAWVALGDLASRRGEEGSAARLYRTAAEALQDLRF